MAETSIFKPRLSNQYFNYNRPKPYHVYDLVKPDNDPLVETNGDVQENAVKETKPTKQRGRPKKIQV